MLNEVKSCVYVEQKVFGYSCLTIAPEHFRVLNVLMGRRRGELTWTVVSGLKGGDWGGVSGAAGRNVMFVKG